MGIATCELDKISTTLEKRQWHRSADRQQSVGGRFQYTAK